jgi:hypothetical protein
MSMMIEKAAPAPRPTSFRVYKPLATARSRRFVSRSRRRAATRN